MPKPPKPKPFPPSETISYVDTAIKELKETHDEDAFYSTIIHMFNKGREKGAITEDLSDAFTDVDGDLKYYKFPVIHMYEVYLSILSETNSAMLEPYVSYIEDDLRLLERAIISGQAIDFFRLIRKYDEEKAIDYFKEQFKNIKIYNKVNMFDNIPNK